MTESIQSSAPKISNIGISANMANQDSKQNKELEFPSNTPLIEFSKMNKKESQLVNAANPESVYDEPSALDNLPANLESVYVM